MHEDIFQTTKTQHLWNVFNLFKFLVLFENNAKGNLTVIYKLINSTFLSLKDFPALRAKYEDIKTDLEQFHEQLRIMREVLNSSLGAYGCIIGNNLNEAMKTLTIFTVLLSNPILIESIYGMDIDLPFANSPHVFYVIIIVSALISSVRLFYMYRKQILYV